MDMIMDIKSYKESLIGGLNDTTEVEETIKEMELAKVGTIKPNCWEKISNKEFKIYSL